MPSANRDAVVTWRRCRAGNAVSPTASPETGLLAVVTWRPYCAGDAVSPTASVWSSLGCCGHVGASTFAPNHHHDLVDLIVDLETGMLWCTSYINHVSL